MRRASLARVLWRAQSVLAKGPGHLLNLGRWYAAQSAQRARGTWRSQAIGEAAFHSQLSLPPDRAAVARHFRLRTQPRFCFAPEEAAAIAARVNAAARAATLARADTVCRHVFQFRGQPPASFGAQVDWLHHRQENIDWTWELNRHAYFVDLGRAFAYTSEARYATEFRSLMLDWLAHNPPGLEAPNWQSVLEVAYRLNVWTWAYYLFRAALDDEALLSCVRGLWLHGRFLAANLEYASPNNHLLLQAKALAQAGLLFPEFHGARRWLEHGLAVLWEQMRAQVHADGVHREQAALYHQIITSELLELITLLQHNHLAAPADIRARFERMLEYEHVLIKPNGEIPLVGDSALGDSYVRFDAVAGGAVLFNRPAWAARPPDEATLWLIGLQSQPLSEPAEIRSQAFPHGGYFIMRHGRAREAAYLLFDCGPFGYPPAPGHGHADALSFELHARGQTLIVDPGVYSYHLGMAWRNFFRGTAAHNTVVVDGQDQTVLLDEWRVVRPARATVHDWVSRDAFDFVAGSHDGYTRLPQPITHQRQIVFVKFPGYWIVWDQLTGQGRHQFELLFHLAPEAHVALEAPTGRARIHVGEEAGLLIHPLAPVPADTCAGSETPIQGWVSRFSGEKKPAPVLRYAMTASAPVAFCTLLYPCAHPDQMCLSVSRLETENGVSGLSVEWDDGLDYCVLDQRPTPGRTTVADFSVVARLAVLRLDRTGHLVSAHLHGAHELTRAGQRLDLDPAGDWKARA